MSLLLFPDVAELIWSPERRFIDELRAASARYPGGRARIAVAWAREDGVLHLIDAIAGHRLRLEVIVGLNDGLTSVEAVTRLLDVASLIAVAFRHPAHLFHPKAYVFDDPSDPAKLGTLLVGSPNLTHGGLTTNIEAILVDSAASRGSLLNYGSLWDSLISSPFTHRITSRDYVASLFRGRYLRLERQLRMRDRSREAMEAKPSGFLPTVPPPRVPRPEAPPLDLSFLGPLPPETPPTTADPEKVAPRADRFYVRTFTVNDLLKLNGSRPGTIEPDIGVDGRDRFPSFWGWKRKYRSVTHRTKSRFEWAAKALLRSASAPPEGIPIDLVLWARPHRPGYPREHRLRPGPISAFKSALPAEGFTAETLLVVERASPEDRNDFVLTVLRPGDPGYSEYASYLETDTGNYRYGYGPAVS